jgi:hypothetical protein
MALSDNAIACWHLNETTGTDFAEEVSANDGTGSGVTANASGKLDKAVSWNSAAGYIQIPGAVSSGQFTGNKVSISMWIKLDNLPSVTGNSIYLLNLHRGAYNPINMIIATDDRLYFYTMASPPTYSEYSNSNAISDTTNFIHIVCVCDGIGTENKIYINGSDATNSSNTLVSNIDTSVGNTANDCIGASSPTAGTEGMVGKIDEVVIWNRALSSSEVTSLYNGGSGLAYPFVTNTYEGVLYIYNGSIWVPKPMNNYAGTFHAHPVYAYYNAQWNLIQSF